MKYFKAAAILMILTILVPRFDLLALAEDTGLGIGPLSMGIPWGGGMNDEDKDVCPQGAQVIQGFIDAWQSEDYKTMYELIDEKSKKDYTLEQARFDFQFIEYKEYRISAIRKKGENYEFFLSYGDWKDGDKDLIKITVDGNSYKVILPSRGSFFRKSI